MLTAFDDLDDQEVILSWFCLGKNPQVGMKGNMYYMWHLRPDSPCGTEVALYCADLLNIAQVSKESVFPNNEPLPHKVRTKVRVWRVATLLEASQILCC